MAPTAAAAADAAISTRKCPCCDRCFKGAESLAEHILSVHEGKMPYPCQQCFRAYRTALQLKKHMKAMHPKERPFPCPICDKSFSKVELLNFHAARLHGEDPTGERGFFRCDICDAKFTVKPNVMKHMQLNHVDEPELVTCDICFASYVNTNALRQHMFAHSEHFSYVCKLCGKTCKSNKRLASHMDVHSESRPYKCDMCGLAFKRSAELSHHALSHSQHKTFQCKLCPKSYAHSESLRKHMSSRHTTERPHVCNVCGKTFKLAYVLRKHMEVHSRAVLHRCEYCFRDFVKADALERHVEQQHTLVMTPRRFLCEKCGKTFQKLVGKQEHERIHHENQRVTCDICEQQLKTMDGLRNHLQRHVDELYDRPYRCPDCPRKFRYTQALRKHMHFFRCDICDWKLGSFSGLLSHMLSNHVKLARRRFTCDKCGYATVRATEMRQHHDADCVPVTDHAAERSPPAAEIYELYK